jgi:hypothetical protein
MSDEARAKFDEMRKQAVGLRRSLNSEIHSLLGLVTALIDHLDPDGVQPVVAMPRQPAVQYNVIMGNPNATESPVDAAKRRGIVYTEHQGVQFVAPVAPPKPPDEAA